MSGLNDFTGKCTLAVDVEIEDVNMKAVENAVANMAAWVHDEFAAMRFKTPANVFRFLSNHNLGYVDSYTHEFLSHDREVVFCRVYPTCPF